MIYSYLKDTVVYACLCNMKTSKDCNYASMIFSPLIFTSFHPLVELAAERGYEIRCHQEWPFKAGWVI